MQRLSAGTLTKLKRWALYSVLGSGGISMFLGLLLWLPLPNPPKQQLEQVFKFAVMLCIGSTCTASWCAISYANQENRRLVEEKKAESICTHCYYHSNSERLPCAVNPHGPIENTCSDYRDAHPEEKLPVEIDI